MTRIDNLIKVWFDKDRGYYQAFTKDGQLIPYLKGITVSDNFEQSGLTTCIINAYCEVVNEQPTEKTT